MSELYPFSQQVRGIRLADGDLKDIEAVLQDRFQSPRARKRACALQVLGGGGTNHEASKASGLTNDMVEAMISRFQKEGLKGALFGVHRTPSTCRYDQDAIVEALKSLVVSRPVGGLYWTLGTLAAEVGKMVPGGGDISHEHLRQIMLKRLGIRSVRHIEPFWKLELARKAAASVA